jgi:multidrug resistance efflux pump
MATDAAYYPVFMPEPGGTVDSLQVTANQEVVQHQVLASLSSQTLEQQLETSRQEYQQLEATLVIKEKQVETAQAQLNAAQSRASGLNQEVVLLDTVPADISGKQGEIQALNREIQGLEEDLVRLDQEIAAFDHLVAEGAVSQIQLNDLQAERSNLTNAIYQRQGQIASNQAAIASVQEQRTLQSQRSQTQLGSASADLQAAQAQLEQSLSEVAEHQDLLLLKAQEVQQLQQQLADHTELQTQITGTVVTDQETLDQLKGKYLAAGEPILEVIKLDELAIETWIRQEDRRLIEPGMTAQVYPQSGSLKGCQAQVVDVASRSEFRPDQQKHMVRTVLQINHCAQQLQPNMTGHARIKTAPMRIYQVALQEVLKLIPINRFR